MTTHADRVEAAEEEQPARLPIATPQFDSTVEIGGLAKGNPDPSALRDSTIENRVIAAGRSR